jgi:hypothetical protein
MDDEANPISLARSRLLQERRTVSLKSVPHGHDDLWSFVMLPDASVVSGPVPPTSSFCVMSVWALTVFFSRGSPCKPRGRIRQHLGPGRLPPPRSGGNRSGKHGRRREGTGGGSAGSSKVRSTGCVSSKDCPLRGRRRGHHHHRRRKPTGVPPRDMESPAPIATGRGGGGGVSARGGRGGTRHWVISGGASPRASRRCRRAPRERRRA